MPKATPIPTETRETIAARDRGCVRCGSRNALQAHHRRSRSVRDRHVHCRCNVVLLCAACHAHVHANPEQAMRDGLIVSRHQHLAVTLVLNTWRGWCVHECEGGRLHVDPPPMLDARLKGRLGWS